MARAQVDTYPETAGCQMCRWFMRIPKIRKGHCTFDPPKVVPVGDGYETHNPTVSPYYWGCHRFERRRGPVKVMGQTWRCE